MSNFKILKILLQLLLRPKINYKGFRRVIKPSITQSRQIQINRYRMPNYIRQSVCYFADFHRLPTIYSQSTNFCPSNVNSSPRGLTAKLSSNFPNPPVKPKDSKNHLFPRISQKFWLYISLPLSSKGLLKIVALVYGTSQREREGEKEEKNSKHLRRRK